MASITTAAVGLNAQPLAPGPVVGAEADMVTVINLDTENTVNLGSAANHLPFPLGPLASQTLTAPVWAAAAEPLVVGIVPGGGAYSPGSLTINGPVTAEITGPVEVEGSISITGTPTVELAAGTTVDVSGIADVNIQNANIDVVGAGGYIAPGQINSVFANAGPVTAAAGGSANLGTFDVSTYLSVIASLGPVSNSSSSAGAAVCAVYQFSWLDINSTLIATDVYSCVVGGEVVYEIPVRGYSLQISMFNLGAGGTLTAAASKLVIDGSYRSVPNTRVVSTVAGAPTLAGCVVVPQQLPVFGVAAWIASIAYTWAGANASVVFLLPQWVGEVTGFYQVITTALARNATVVDLTYAVQGQVTSGSTYQFGIVQNIPGSIDANPVPVNFNLPPTQCAVIVDTPAAVGEFFMSLIGAAN